MSTKYPSRRVQELDAFLREYTAVCPLDDWTSFAREIQAPPVFAVALMTGRPEMMRLVPGQALTAEQCKHLYDVIATLIETNYALRAHAQNVAQLVDTWSEAFKQLDSLGEQIRLFANFKRLIEDEEAPRELDGALGHREELP